ncbi:Uncharacterised protein [Legionella busanensis]|uniref:Uncharacterized protein n=1 Tax=Legionella busanensis TaxID=190655 RepID=A0A378JU46_9GAMM|nr:hypothetical protein [Legionella busanensis]STX51722.1 Uncharacterised protein [Legionella busanensis]
MLVNSRLGWTINICLILCLVLNFISVYNNPIPYKHFKKLIFLKDEWILAGNSGLELKYEKMRIILDCGLFFLMELRSNATRKVIVIFADQLSHDKKRLLRLIEKVH